MIAVIVDLLQDMFQKLCITHPVLLPLSTFVIGQYRGWPAKLFTKWHFISANRIYSGYGKCSLECCLPKSLCKVIFVQLDYHRAKLIFSSRMLAAWLLLLFYL